MQNKKSLGQNWLSDRDTLQAITDLAELSEAENVLEIGPGLGYLTDKLLVSGAKVTALEFDQDLISKLVKKYENHKNKPVIVEGDIRKFDFSTMPADFKICANIPYYLTANLMRLLTETDNKPSVAVMLVQKEVAQKLASENRRGMLNVLVGFWYEASLGPIVPAELFEPAPKVDSQVLVLKRKQESLMPADNWPEFVKTVKVAFSNPRKMLRTNFAAGLNITKDQADEMLKRTKIDPNKRAEQLKLDEWLGLLVLRDEYR